MRYGTFSYKKQLYEELVLEIVGKYNPTDFLPRLKTQLPLVTQFCQSLESFIYSNLARFPLVTQLSLSYSLNSLQYNYLDLFHLRLRTTQDQDKTILSESYIRGIRRHLTSNQTMIDNNCDQRRQIRPYLTLTIHIFPPQRFYKKHNLDLFCLRLQENDITTLINIAFCARGYKSQG